VPLLAGTALLAGGLWRRRQALDAALGGRPWLARAGAFVAGLGLGLLVASVYAFFWWWAIGATLLSVALLVAAVVAARSEGPRARARSGHRRADLRRPGNSSEPM
jgi:heme exporter protein D